MTHKALKVKDVLKNEGINAGVIDMFSLKTINDVSLFNLLDKYKSILTLEEGFVGKGGLDSLVQSVLEKNNSIKKVKTLGFKDSYVFEIGSREYLHKLNGLDEASVITKIKGSL